MCTMTTYDHVAFMDVQLSLCALCQEDNQI